MGQKGTTEVHVECSDFFFAEIPLRSPRKLFISIIKKYIFRIKVSKKINNLILKKRTLVECGGLLLAHPRVSTQSCVPSQTLKFVRENKQAHDLENMYSIIIFLYRLVSYLGTGLGVREQESSKLGWRFLLCRHVLPF